MNQIIYINPNNKISIINTELALVEWLETNVSNFSKTELFQQRFVDPSDSSVRFFYCNGILWEKLPNKQLQGWQVITKSNAVIACNYL